MTPFKVSLFCSLLLLTIASLQAATYTGRVIDGETGAGLPGVSITLLDSGGKASTDQEGQFSITTAAVNVNHLHWNKPGLLQWRNSANAFDLKSAPQVTSILLANLKGERLFFEARTPGSETIKLPVVSKNIYVLRIATQNGVFFTVKWVHLGNNAAFPLIGNTTSVLSKQAKIVATFSLEKQGYQPKQAEIDGDSANKTLLIKMKPEIGYRIFDEDTIRTYRLYLTTAEMAMLLDYGKLVPKSYTVNTVVVPARLTIEGRTLDSVGIRFRGDQSLWDCVVNGARKKNVKYPQFGFGNSDICAKFSMKFDFNEYRNDQRLFGLKALNFRSMSADPTKMHEKLGFSLFNDMGIATPRTAYARLYVNDSLWGLFGVTEEIDGRFTKSRYPKTGDGNLYKEIWPRAQLTDASILDALTTNNDTEDNPDISDFKALRDSVAASGTDSSNFLEKMRTHVDIPHLVRYIVVDRGIMNFDGIMADYGGTIGRHNCFWYHDDESGLFKLFPWDLDKALLYPEPNFWTNNAPVGTNIAPNWNVVNTTYSSITCVFDPGSSGGSYKVTSIDKDKFLRLLRGTTWNDFRSQGQLFLDSMFTGTKLNPKITRWRSLIAGAVGEDPTIDSAEWSIMVDSLSHTIPLWRKNLRMMMDTLMVK